MYSTKEIQNTIEELDDSVGKCQKMVDEVSLSLRRMGVEHDVLEGRFSAWRIDEGVGESYHWYIKIEKDQIMGCDCNIILDPTISQFTKNNYVNDQVEAYIPDSYIPSGFVVKKSDRIYQAYQKGI